MKKKGLLIALPALAMGLASCTNPPTTSDSSGTDDVGASSTPVIGGGGEINIKDFSTALKADYSNATVAYTQTYGDGAFSETAWEYYVDGYLVVDNITMAEQGYTDWYRYSVYQEYQDDWYAYWDKSTGYEYSGWISNGYRDADLAPHHAYFTIPHLVETISVEDVELLMGTYFVKEEAIERIVRDCFEFYGDPFAGANPLTSISIRLDEQGRFSKIVASKASDSDDGVVIEFGYYGETASPIALPEEVHEGNIYTYQEMKGDAFVPDVYAEEVHLSFADSSETSKTLLLDDSIELAWRFVPSEVNAGSLSWVSSDENVISLTAKTHFGDKRKYATAVGVGEADVYCVYVGKDGIEKKSEILHFTVQGLPEFDKKDAVYDFLWTADEEVLDEQGQYLHTALSASNLIPGGAPYEIKAHNMRLLDAKHADGFGRDGYVLEATPSLSDFMNKGFYSEITFDFADQQVASLSFHYALHRAAQKGDALSGLAEATLSTSNDGISWSEPISLKDEMLASFEKINVDYGANEKALTRDFAPASKVKIRYKANGVGKNIGICMDDFLFKKNELCHDHVETTIVPVSAVELSSSVARLKIGESAQLAVTVSPADATDKSVTYAVEPSGIVEVSPTGLVKALSAGRAEIKAIASNGIESTPVVFEVYSQEQLPDSAKLGRYAAKDVYASSAWYRIDLNLLSRHEASLALRPDGGEAKTTSFVLESYDASSRLALYQGEGMTLRVRFIAEGVEIFLRGGAVDLGNDHTGTGETLVPYVQGKAIVAKQNGKEIQRLSLREGETVSFSAQVNPANAFDADVRALSSSPLDLRIEETETGNYFNVTALKSGQFTVELSTSEGLSYTLPVEVRTPTTIESFSLSAGKSQLKLRETVQIVLTFLPASPEHYSLTYVSENPNIIQVAKNKDGSATATALAAGKAMIVAKDEVTKKEARIELTVVEEATSLPADFVGTFQGQDGVGSTIELTVNADGNGTLSHVDTGLDYALSLVVVDGKTATFHVEFGNGYDLIVETNGSVVFLTFANGEYVEEPSGGYLYLTGESFDRVG